jgi:hypothetical protein
MTLSHEDTLLMLKKFATDSKSLAVIVVGQWGFSISFGSILSVQSGYIFLNQHGGSNKFCPMGVWLTDSMVCEYGDIRDIARLLPKNLPTEGQEALESLRQSIEGGLVLKYRETEMVILVEYAVQQG